MNKNFKLKINIINIYVNHLLFYYYNYIICLKIFRWKEIIMNKNFKLKINIINIINIYD
jgi:hypothetical protein